MEYGTNYEWKRSPLTPSVYVSRTKMIRLIVASMITFSCCNTWLSALLNVLRADRSFERSAKDVYDFVRMSRQIKTTDRL
jgi:hypothetical protein